MGIKNFRLLLFLMCIGSISIFTYCSKDEPVDLNSDSLDTYLYKESLSMNRYYNAFDSSKFKKDSLPRVFESATNSPHGKYFSLSMNHIAFSNIDTAVDVLIDTNKIANSNRFRPFFGKNFQDSSIFILKGFSEVGVKEQDITLVMMKLPKSDKSYGGYIWTGYKRDGTIIFSSDSKGKACGQCHARSDYDYVMSYN